MSGDVVKKRVKPEVSVDDIPQIAPRLSDERVINILSKTIADNMDKVRLANNLAITKPDKDRVGAIAFTFAAAVEKANFKFFKGAICYYHEGVYENLPVELFEDVVLKAMEDLGVSDSDLTNTEKKLIMPSIRKCRRKSLSPKKWIVAFNNGILNMDTMAFGEFDPKHDVVNKLSYDYKKDADCPLWKWFLEDVLGDDMQKVDVLQEYLGNIFLDRKTVKLEKIAVLLGGGSNGKSVVHETIKYMLGSWNMSTLALSSVMGDGDKAMQAVAFVDGKLLNYCPELGKKELNDSGFKQIVSGESTPARNLYKSIYQAQDIPVMMANTNELPIVIDKSDGFFRRFMIIRFAKKITDDAQDAQLSVKLQSEMSGIFNWIIEGRNRFVRNKFKFTRCEAIKNELKNYRDTAVPEMRFLRDKGYLPERCYVGQRNLEHGVTKFFTEFSDWCSKNGHIAGGSGRFGQFLEAEGYTKKRVSSGMVYNCFETPSLGEWDELYAMKKTRLSKSEFAEVLNGSKSAGIVDCEDDGTEEIMMPPAEPQQVINYTTPEYSEEEEDFDPSNPLGMPDDPE